MQDDIVVTVAAPSGVRPRRRNVARQSFAPHAVESMQQRREGPIAKDRAPAPVYLDFGRA